MFAGLLLFLSGTVILMGIVTAEIFYPPGYSITYDFISTLGSTPPPTGISYQPSASIFDGAMIIGGLLIILSTYLLFTQKMNKLFLIALLLLGIGALGVGLFAAKTGAIHLFFAFTTFLCGGVAAILSSRFIRIPFAYVSILLGLLTILFIFLGVFGKSIVVPLLGSGGTERWAAYPLMIWLLGVGGYLMASRK